MNGAVLDIGRNAGGLVANDKLAIVSAMAAANLRRGANGKLGFGRQPDDRMVALSSDTLRAIHGCPAGTWRRTDWAR